jgi:hypothetical protein
MATNPLAATPFACPNCGAQYKLVRAEAGALPARQIIRCRCGGPLKGREGKFILKYFLVDQPWTQAQAECSG